MPLVDTQTCEVDIAIVPLNLEYWYDVW